MSPPPPPPPSRSNLRVQPVTQQDMPRCMDIVLTSFASAPITEIIAGDNTPENRALSAQRHWRGFCEHVDAFPSAPLPGIACVYRTGEGRGDEEEEEEEEKQKIVGFAEWFIWDRERAPEEYCRENYILRLEWVRDAQQRERCLALMGPEIGARRRRMGGRPFGLLMYLCVDPEYRGRGAATACVRWGMERCAELGIPAYLEASEEGMGLYKRLGWEMLKEEEGQDGDAKFPAMIWWPPHLKRE